MHTSTIATIVVALIVIALAVLVYAYTRTRRLRSRFGPEYEREVRERGSRWRGEAALTTRERRVERLQIRPLTQLELDRFARAWQAAQARFVDDPAGAVTEADGLLTELMKARGYPTWDSDFEQRAADVSVGHAELVQNYRAAEGIVQRLRSGEATTEELRMAMVHYRALFDDLLETKEAAVEGSVARGA